jgi:hypothetical protein
MNQCHQSIDESKRNEMLKPVPFKQRYDANHTKILTCPASETTAAGMATKAKTKKDVVMYANNSSIRSYASVATAAATVSAVGFPAEFR